MRSPRAIGLIELGAEPTDLLGRDARRPRLLRVEPDEPKPVQASSRRKARQRDGGTRCAWVVLDIVVADQREMRHVQPAANLVEEPELIFGRILDVVADELDEVGPDQVLTSSTTRWAARTFSRPGSVRCRSPGTTMTTGLSRSFMVSWSPESMERC